MEDEAITENQIGFSNGAYTYHKREEFTHPRFNKEEEITRLFNDWKFAAKTGQYPAGYVKKEKSA